MNLKLAKKIRQGMREMAQVHTGGAIRGVFPDDYQIGVKGYKWVGYSEDWALMPYSVSAISLRHATPRHIYKLAKRLVA